MRRSRTTATAALLLLVTSLWLPWWLVRFRDSFGQTIDEAATHVWRPGLFVHEAGPWISGALAAGVVLLLFVRIAGQSWHHEPATWRRDIAAAGLITAASVLNALWWPRTSEEVIAGFWSRVEFTVNGTNDAFSVVTLPGLGWWLALGAAALLGVAWWLTRET